MRPEVPLPTPLPLRFPSWTTLLVRFSPNSPPRLPASTAHSSISPFRSHAHIHPPRPRNSCALYLYPLHYRFIYRSQNNDETSNTPPLPYPFFGFRSMRWRPPGAILTRYFLHLASWFPLSCLCAWAVLTFLVFPSRPWIMQGTAVAPFVDSVPALYRIC